MEPSAPIVDDAQSRPVKKSRSGYFGEFTSKTSSPSTTHPYRFPSTVPDNTGLFSKNTPMSRYPQLRYRGSGFGSSMNGSIGPYLADHEPTRLSYAMRWDKADLVPANYRDGTACARFDSRYNTYPVANASAPSFEYHDLTRKRSIEEDAR